MATNDVPTVRHRRLAAELRRLREAKGFSAEEVVSRVPGMNLPKLSRYENARVAIPKAEIVGPFFWRSPGRRLGGVGGRATAMR